jgi:predicted nucleic acid-binding protein
VSQERFFLDTVFVQAVLNRNDQFHDRATRFLPRVREAAQSWVTEAVLAEIGDGLAGIDRAGAARFIRQCYTTSNIHVVEIGSNLFRRGLELYENRPDKQWGMTDCLSFVVMRDQNLMDAVTADTHFVQAGFRALLLSDV